MFVNHLILQIQTFRSQLLRKVIIIDGAHLKGDYLGTMFLAVGMDANNQVVPIAIEWQSLRVASRVLTF